MNINPLKSSKYLIELAVEKTHIECLKIFDSNVPNSFLEEEKPEFLDFLRRFSNSYWLVRDETGLAVGCGGLASSSPRETTLCWGMVSADKQKKGIGAYLLGLRLLLASEDKQLESVLCNTSQITEGFFKKFGFITENVDKNYYAPGLDAVKMRLNLTDQARENIKQTFSNLDKINC